MVYHGELSQYGSIRIIGANFGSGTGGEIDFTIFSNHTNSVDCKGKAGSGSRFVLVYIGSGKNFYIKVPNGMVVSFIAFGTTIAESTLPEDATQLTINPY